jgi:hypothetical protein
MASRGARDPSDTERISLLTLSVNARKFYALPTRYTPYPFCTFRFQADDSWLSLLPMLYHPLIRNFIAIAVHRMAVREYQYAFVVSVRVFCSILLGHIVVC